MCPGILALYTLRLSTTINKHSILLIRSALVCALTGILGSMNLTTLALLCVVTAVYSVDQVAESFSKLSSHYIVPAWERMTFLLDGLNEETSPSDVQVLRKSILRSRDLLDAFSPVFFNSSTSHQDEFIVLRKSIDIGYTLIGDFQDLAHAHIKYKPHELVKRRNACLKWKGVFDVYTKDLAILDYIDNSGALYRHAKESRFYWDLVPRILPMAGLCMLQQLVRAQLYAVVERDSNMVLTESILDYVHINSLFKANEYLG